MSQGTPYDPYARTQDPYGQPYETGATATGPVADPTPEDPTKQAAKQEAAEVKQTAADAGKRVAGTAKGEAANVATEAKQQAKGLVQQAAGEVRSQAHNQQQRLAGGIGSVADQLRAMANGEKTSGPVNDLVQRGAERTSDIARWLESRDTSDLLEEVKYFARRRPWAFLGGSAVLGLVVSRFAKGLAADSKESSSYGSGYSGPQGYGAPVSRGYSDSDYSGTDYTSPSYTTGDSGYTTPQSGVDVGTDYTGTTESGYVQPGYATTGGESYDTGTTSYPNDRGDLTR